MNVAILSGKGGTGKTTVSTNLAIALKANYIDCDVEEPNGFIFLKPSIEEIEDVMVDYPVIDEDKCIHCGKCTNICQFNALAKVRNKIKVFEKLCHSCGACKIVCESDAVDYKKRSIGKIEKGVSRDIICSRGTLDIGEPMAVSIIKQLLRNLPKGNNLIDCPPGTSCNVVTTLKYVDACVLVTEPSEFGLHDLKLAVELVRMYNIPFGIVINKDDSKENIIKEYCKNENIKILGLIPYSKDIASTYSNGNMLYDNSNTKAIFDKLSSNVKEALLWN